MVINGIELEFDSFDADTIEKYEAAYRHMQEAEAALPTAGSRAELIKQHCLVAYAFFDEVFGEGTGDKIFQGKYNLRVCTDAIRAVQAADFEAQQEYAAAFAAALDKYVKPGKRDGK